MNQHKLTTMIELNLPHREKSILIPLTMIAVLLIIGCNNKEIKSVEVTATAYNSVPEQTVGHPGEGAWGDTLHPDIKSIAVSNDLVEMGLTQNTKVEIEGLPGEFVVLDKMNSRWEKKIDIYLGKNVKEAREWGTQKVTISWEADQ